MPLGRFRPQCQSNSYVAYAYVVSVDKVLLTINQYHCKNSHNPFSSLNYALSLLKGTCRSKKLGRELASQAVLQVMIYPLFTF